MLVASFLFTMEKAVVVVVVVAMDSSVVLLNAKIPKSPPIGRVRNLQCS